MDNILAFESAKKWEGWLKRNHSKSDGIWLRAFKKGSGVKSVKIPEALDAALCYGWITGQARPYDDISWLNRFTPRRPRSIWSKINTAHAERLIKEGRMKPAGMRQIEAAKADGRWGRAYTPPSRASLPRDFLNELSKNRKAAAFCKNLNKANIYAIVFRLENSKNEDDRKAKISSIVKMLESGKKFH